MQKHDHYMTLSDFMGLVEATGLMIVELGLGDIVSKDLQDIVALHHECIYM